MIYNHLKTILLTFSRRDSDFLTLFFNNEYDSLAGVSNKRITTLFIILLVTFLALAFAIGSIDYLSTKMSNPFTNWVDMPILYNYNKGSIEKMKNSLESQQEKDKYKLKSITEYAKFSPKFFHNQTKETFYIPGITLDVSGDLLKKILSPKDQNVLSGQELKSDESLRESDFDKIIVTETLLNDLGYSDIDGQKKIAIAYDTLRFYADILAVVKELPNLSGFACFPKLYNWLAVSNDKTFCLSYTGQVNKFHIIAEGTTSTNLQNIFQSNITSHSLANLKESDFTINEYQPHKKYTIYLEDWYPVEQLQQVTSQLLSNLKARNIQATFLSNWDCSVDPKFNNIKSPPYLAFNFNQLDQVRPFKDYMRNEYDVEISMNQIESKETFSLVSQLTLIISSILFLFGLTSIVFYVNSLLKNHLEKIKSNLGTFKAFGLNNDSLTSNYRKIILLFLIIATITAFAIASIIVVLEEILSTNSCLNLYNGWVLLAVIILIFLSYIISERTIKNILMHTPGDLIYNRVK